MGIRTVRDLVFRFPFRHEDFSLTVPIADAPIGEHVTVLARVERVQQKGGFRRRIGMAQATLRDDSGQITALWFNQPYLSKMLPVGVECRFAGKVTQTKMGRRLVNPLFQARQPDENSGTNPLNGVCGSGRSGYVGDLIPVYSTPAGLSQHAIRRLMSACRPLLAGVSEYLPGELVQRHQLAPLNLALLNVHFPEDRQNLAAARKRLAFDEMLRLQLAVGILRRQRQGRRAPAVPFDREATRAFVGRLPFRLTDDQRRAAWEALQDMMRPVPMSRLLDGDVGTGKTAVAAVAMVNAAKAGFQSALMAPTEILAKQHFDTLTRMFAAEGLPLALWTNSYKRLARDGREVAADGAKPTRLLASDIAEGRVAAVVGTHALTENALAFDRLALAVVDEQHRFGVNTRQKLCQKSGLSGIEPHLLSMTATPIPRSLALTVYGDLDLSLLRDKPRNRPPVITCLNPPASRNEAFAAIRREIEAGHQAFVVCPLISESDRWGSMSVNKSFEQLKNLELKGIPLAVLHGKLSAEDKERVMADFLAKRVMVLISTSVVEVGVDVPNATVMVIEGAERFGLAQLHQFRGRVGRGDRQSYCHLLPGVISEDTEKRLKSLVDTADGFELAEKDLRLRGTGDLLGTVQSGRSGLNLASLFDLPLVKATRQAADWLLDRDPGLGQWPELGKLVSAAIVDEVHME